jgi:hypothetical protein
LVEGYLDQVRKAVEGLNRWQLKRWLVLGHFSFGRFAMCAGVAASFATFGHPARSAWAKVTFSDFPRYDVPRFIKALEALRTSALSTREAIARYTGIGVTNVSSFAAIADLTEKLPQLPDFDPAAIADLDIDDFKQALRVQADLLKIEEELNALSDLRHEDPEKLAVAAAHMRSAVSAEFLEQTPAEAYEFANADIRALEALAEAVEAVVPVLGILGLSPPTPHNDLHPTARDDTQKEGREESHRDLCVKHCHCPR